MRFSLPDRHFLEALGRKLVADPKSALQMCLYAAQKARQLRPQLHRVWDEFQVLLRLVKAWLSREYLDVSWRHIALMAGAIFYFINPLDLIPDFIFQIGLLDDLAVLAAVLKVVHDELRRFKEWEISQSAKLKRINDSQL